MVVIDAEVYTNYFLLSAKQLDSGRVVHFELYDGNALDKKALSKLMRSYTTISFNGLNYDLLIITAALSGFSNEAIKKLSDQIIKSGTPAWQIARNWDLDVPKWDHIDLFEVSPGKSSLKIYGGRLNAPKMQDLPIEPDAIITPEQRALLRKYCVNDLDTTELLYRKLEKQVALRKQMSEQYGMDLRSKSDAQIAETVIKSEMSAITGREYYKPKGEQTAFRYLDPKIITFKTELLQEVFDRILQTRFELGGNGAVKMPDWLKAERIKIGSSEYQMGIGGLHSCEKSQYIRATEKTLICDLDVASYYPSIILQQRLAPKSLGEPFLKVYQSIVDRRIKAKRSGDTVTADTLKIAVNGSFGKLGSKYSALYAPELLIQTTITGQLALLMLIERMELVGVRVASANTDGIVCVCPKSREGKMQEVAFEWMLDTSYELERVDYSAVASRDVNSYVAVKTNGDVKGKGCFAPPSLAKNPDLPIVYQAVAKQIADGTPAEKTIRECKDITKFVTVRRVQGGAEWRGEYVGKAVRFYYSTEVADDECIHYAKNSNRVPKSAGAKPLMDLPDTFPTDVNYQAYIVEAEKLLAEVGYA